MNLNFTSFARQIGVKLTPAQRTVARVAFDGVDPCDLPESDRDLSRTIFGPVEDIEETIRSIFAAVCGARAGKSYVFGALRLLHLALTVSLDTLAPGEAAFALVVAPDMRLARQTLRYALGAARAVPSVARLISEESADSFTLRRERGRTVTIECLPATRGGSAVRGRSLVGAVLDECAFFRDADFIVNDVEVFRAIAPRILPGGQLVMVSTPWAETGLLYEAWRDNFGAPHTCLVAHAPTTLLRPDDRTVSIVERERQRDPDNARREFDAEFVAGGTGLFLDPGAVDACIQDYVLPAAPSGGTVGAGADFGFRSDSSAIAIVERKDQSYALLALEEERPRRGAPLRPSAVASAFADIARSYRCSDLTADSHYAESIREHLREHDLQLRMVPSSADGKVATYLTLRAVVNEGRLRLPRHSRLIAQLKALVSRPTPGGGLQILSPRRAGGGHGDLVSALVCAVHRVHEKRVQQAPCAVTRRFDYGMRYFCPDDPWGEPGPARCLIPGAALSSLIVRSPRE